MCITEFGIVTDFKAKHLLKVPRSIFVMVLGMTTEVIPRHHAKAPSPMERVKPTTV